jgi:hypothetical protein
MIVYNQNCINARLAAVSATIDAGGANGSLVLLSNATVISTISLARPSAIASGGVLTFQGTPVDINAIGTGNVTTAQFQDSNGTVVASGLSVDIPGSGADVVLSNGLNTTLITSGQVVILLAVQIIGS